MRVLVWLFVRQEDPYSGEALHPLPHEYAELPLTYLYQGMIVSGYGSSTTHDVNTPWPALTSDRPSISHLRSERDDMVDKVVSRLIVHGY